MAKITYKLVPPEFDSFYNKVLTPNDRYTFSSVRRLRSFNSRARAKGITEKSVLFEASTAWNSLTALEQTAWGTAGAVSGLNGYRHFVKDFAWRKKLELVGTTTPDILYQVEVGRLSIQAPATSIKIGQYHPLNYWVARKVPGTDGQLESISITENFALPLELALSWKTELTSAGASPSARIYAVVYSHYQGRDIETEIELPFGLMDNWKRESVSISAVLGVVKGYTVFIEAYDVSGDIYFDNVSLVHSGHNWARDPRCYNITTSYTRAFYQIPKHWVAENVGEGAFFDSYYYNQ